MKATFLILFFTTALSFAQGPIAPSAAPAPTMKTLAQIEARTAIPASPTVSIAGPHFTISQPGSYYLTGNVQDASGNGINIDSSNVTLDLNGFALISTTVSPAAGSAIELASRLRSIVIKNGRITGGAVRTYVGPNVWNSTYSDGGWSHGINDSSSNASGCLISHLTVAQCKEFGILLYGGACLEHVNATDNGGYGIFASQGSVTNSTATYNGNSGISAFQGGVTNSTATITITSCALFQL